MHVTSGNGGPALIKAGKDGLPEIKNPVDDHINGNEVWDAVIDGTYTFTGTKHYDPAEKRDIDIHVIYHSSGNKLQTNVGMARAIEAHRKVDMVVAHAQFFTSGRPLCRHHPAPHHRVGALRRSVRRHARP